MSWWPSRKPRSHQALQETEIWRGAFVPRNPQVLHGDHAPDLANLFIRSFCCDQVKYREDNARQLSQPLRPDLHGGPEPRIQGGQNPGCSKVHGIVPVKDQSGSSLQCGPCGLLHICHGLRTGQADEGGEIAGGVEVYHRGHHSLPCCQSLGEELGYRFHANRAMFLSSNMPLVQTSPMEKLLETYLYR